MSSHSHSQKKRRARIWLAILFVVLAAANALLLRFSFDPRNPFAILRGLSFGATLWTAMLLLGMWLRHGWARYVLSTLIVLTASAFSFSMLLMWDDHSGESAPYFFAFGGLALYGLSLVPLGASRSIHHLMGG